MRFRSGTAAFIELDFREEGESFGAEIEERWRNTEAAKHEVKRMAQQNKQ